MALQRRLTLPAATETTSLTDEPGRLGWQDAIRALELDDAVRRSVEPPPQISLEVQEATEEASFMGGMTLVGSGLLWLSLLAHPLGLDAAARMGDSADHRRLHGNCRCCFGSCRKRGARVAKVRSQESGDQESEVRSPRSEGQESGRRGSRPRNQESNPE